MANDHLTIEFKDQIITLNFNEFDDHIDVDQLTQINYFNLFAEIITVPALMNRVGIWKAEAEHKYNDFKIDLKVYEANRSKYYRTNKTVTVNDKVKKPTVAEVDNAVDTDEGVILRRKKLNSLKRDMDVVDGLYWAIKSKDGKLDKMSENFNLNELDSELTEKAWNGILIRKNEKLIKG